MTSTHPQHEPTERDQQAWVEAVSAHGLTHRRDLYDLPVFVPMGDGEIANLTTYRETRLMRRLSALCNIWAMA